MKTTIELPDDLAFEARRVAAESGTTLRSIVEEALRRELERRAERPAWRPNPNLAFGTGGFTEEFKAMTWSEIREMVNTR